MSGLSPSPALYSAKVSLPSWFESHFLKIAARSSVAAFGLADGLFAPFWARPLSCGWPLAVAASRAGLGGSAFAHASAFAVSDFTTAGFAAATSCPSPMSFGMLNSSALVPLWFTKSFQSPSRTVSIGGM